MSNDDKQLNPFDWGSLEKMLGRKLPFVESGHLEKFMKDFTWIERYVQDILNKTLPANPAQTSLPTPQIPSEIFETHKSLIVKVKLPEKTNPRAVQIFLQPNQVTLSGLPDHKKQTIKLPALVMRKHSKASFRDGTLQISLRKHNSEANQHEIYIQFPD